MSDSRAYFSSSRTSRRDIDDRKQEQRLPSLHNIVGDAYGSSSPYNFHDVRSSLPHYPSHDNHDRSLKLAPYIHPESSSSRGTYSARSNSAQPSTRQYPHTGGIAPPYGSSRSNADYPSNHGHSFQTFYKSERDLVPVTSSSTRPQGMVRACDIPDEDDDPRKRYKCKECGKGFDRPSSLETHSLRHTGDKPFACPASGCDKSFSVRSNMSRHFRKQHEGEEDDDPRSNRQTVYSTATSSRSSPPSGAFYSSSRRM